MTVAQSRGLSGSPRASSHRRAPFRRQRTLLSVLNVCRRRPCRIAAIGRLPSASWLIEWQLVVYQLLKRPKLWPKDNRRPPHSVAVDADQRLIRTQFQQLGIATPRTLPLPLSRPPDGQVGQGALCRRTDRDSRAPVPSPRPAVSNHTPLLRRVVCIECMHLRTPRSSRF